MFKIKTLSEKLKTDSVTIQFDKHIKYCIILLLMNFSRILLKIIYFIWTDAIKIFLCYFETIYIEVEYTHTMWKKTNTLFVYYKNKAFEYNSAIFMLELFHYFITRFCWILLFLVIIQKWMDGNTSFICFVAKSLTSPIAVLQLRIHYFSKSHVSVQGRTSIQTSVHICKAYELYR